MAQNKYFHSKMEKWGHTNPLGKTLNSAPLCPVTGALVLTSTAWATRSTHLSYLQLAKPLSWADFILCLQPCSGGIPLSWGFHWALGLTFTAPRSGYHYQRVQLCSHGLVSVALWHPGMRPYKLSCLSHAFKTRTMCTMPPSSLSSSKMQLGILGPRCKWPLGVNVAAFKQRTIFNCSLSSGSLLSLYFHFHKLEAGLGRVLPLGCFP